MSGEAPMSDSPAMPAASAAPWGRYTAVMAALGAASAYVISNWAAIEPVIESPSIIVLSMLAVFGLGGLSAYWLLARPHEDRLRRAETVINRLREQERQFLQREGDMKAEIARLEVAVTYLRDELDAIKSQIAAAPAPKRKTPPKA